jgi:uncharacterized protein (TIGR02466 family)
MPVEGWFATPIYWNKVDSEVFNDIQKELSYAEEKLKTDGLFKHQPTWNPGTHQLTNMKRNLIDDYNLKIFEKEILRHIDLFKNTLNVPKDDLTEFKIKSSWMTKTSKNEYAHVHYHKKADISGVYYYKTTGKDGSIIFESPLPVFDSLIMDSLPDITKYTPEVGKILLFPGWLRHGVEPNYTDDDRYSISFDIIFKRREF